MSKIKEYIFNDLTEDILIGDKSFTDLANIYNVDLETVLIIAEKKGLKLSPPIDIKTEDSKESFGLFQKKRLTRF